MASKDTEIKKKKAIRKKANVGQKNDTFYFCPFACMCMCITIIAAVAITLPAHSLPLRCQSSSVTMSSSGLCGEAFLLTVYHFCLKKKRSISKTVTLQGKAKNIRNFECHLITNGIKFNFYTMERAAATIKLNEIKLKAHGQ